MTNEEAVFIDHLERAALLEEFASLLQHDLRGQLCVVTSATYYLRKKLLRTPAAQADPQVSVSFDLIEQAVRGIDKLLEERSKLNKEPSGSTPRQRLREGVELGIDRFTARVPEAPPIEVSFDAEHVMVGVSACELALVIDCLLRNAAEAAPGKPIVIQCSTDEKQAWVTVTDEGDGLLANEYRSALTPMKTTKDGHLGLGLNVARGVTNRHGGELSFERAESGGLSVRLMFPCV